MRNKRYIPYLLLLPFILFFVLPLMLSLYSMLRQSFGIVPGAGLNEVTTGYYSDVLNSEMFYSSLCFSIAISAVSSILSVSIGFAAAFFLSEEDKEEITMSILRLPILLPHFTAAFLVFLLLSQSGLASRVSEGLGLISRVEQFPSLIFDPFGFGIIISYVWKEVPFCILFLYPTLKLVSRGLGETAYLLGASKLQYLMQVALPTCRESVMSLFIILFAYDFGAFEVPFILGASYPKAIGVLGYLSYVSADLGQRPYTMALNIIITIMSAALIAAYLWLLKKIKSLEGQI